MLDVTCRSPVPVEVTFARLPDRVVRLRRGLLTAPTLWLGRSARSGIAPGRPRALGEFVLVVAGDLAGPVLGRDPDVDGPLGVRGRLDRDLGARDDLELGGGRAEFHRGDQLEVGSGNRHRLAASVSAA